MEKDNIKIGDVFSRIYKPMGQYKGGIDHI